MKVDLYILSIFIPAAKYFCFFSILKFYRFPLPLLAIISLSLSLALFKNCLYGPIDEDHWQYLVQQIFQGSLLALPWVLFFELLPIALKLFDLLRGTFIAEQQFPGIETRQSSLEGLGSYLAVILFFYLAGYEPMIQQLFVSVEITNFDNFLNYILISSNEILKLSFKMIFPVLTVLMGLELLQIVLVKLLPRFYPSAEFQNFKLCLSLVLLIFLLEQNIPQLLATLSLEISGITKAFYYYHNV